MEKIKSLLHPHGHDKDNETAGDVTHDQKSSTGTAAQSSTATPGNASGTTGHQTTATPIYDQMTGRGDATSTTGDTPKFSNMPNVSAGAGTGAGTGTGTGTGTTTSADFGDEKHAGRLGTDGPVDGARTGDSSHIGGSTPHSDDPRPQVSSGAYDGNSEASIKSGVIGFTPGKAGQGHAALPNNNTAEDRLNHNQVVGQGNLGSKTTSGLRNEVTHDQPSIIPVSSGAAHNNSDPQAYDSVRTTGTERSFPLSGGVTSGQHDHGSTAHGLSPSEREPGTRERELAAGDRHDRQGVAGAAVAAATTAAAMHSGRNEGSDPQVGTFSDRNTSPTGHTHLTSSVREHNIHPDALHAAGARPLNDSDEPGHGPPHETPHVNTGTLLDYEKAYGSDPHTQHTGLLDYRPHAHRTGTSPHIPGEFPSPTPDNERSGPILGATGSTSGTTTVPSTSHDLRHTGSLDDPTPRSADQTDHHLGRDAAIAGGIGAAGLGAAAHQKDGTSASGTGNLYDDKSPYSSKALDPRVTGGEARLNEQRFEPSATTSTSTSQPLSSTTESVTPSKPGDEHHYARNAAIGGGALGAGALAGSALSGNRHLETDLQDSSSLPTTQHTTGTTNPSTVGTTSTSHQLPSSSTTASTAHPATASYDEPQSQHHYGRDAAIAGGAGAAGYGAYETAKAYGDHRSTQPGASMQEQRYDTNAAGARAPNPVPSSSEYNYHNPDVAALAGSTGAGPTGYHAATTGNIQQPHTTAQMAQSGSSQPPQAYKSPDIDNNDLGPKDNSSRNAALGAGAGLAGATAVGYGLSQHGDKGQHPPDAGTLAQPGTSSLSQPTSSLQGQQYAQNMEPSQTHTGRDAALAGGAGAAVGAGAGYAYGQRTQPQFDSKEQERLDKEAAKHQHDLEKKHEKDLKKHEKEAAKHDEKEKEKSGGILGFLHRDKSKKEKKERSPETTPRRSTDRRSMDRRSGEHNNGRDAAIVGGVGAGAVGVAGDEDKFGHGSGYKGRNLLRKEPPEGHPAREALHANNRVGVDGPIGRVEPDPADRTSEHHYGRDAAIGGGAIGAGVLGAHELSKDRTEPSTLSGSSSSAPAVHDTTVSGQHSSGLAGHQTTLPDRTRDDHHYGRDAALAGGAVGAGGLAAHELHGKQPDPSAGHPGTGLAGPQQAANQPGFVSGKREHIGVDGPIGDPNMISGDRQTRQGVWGAHPVSDLAQDRTVIEPRTGLPMNVGRYGDGAGGTDGGPVGHHGQSTVEGVVKPGAVDTQHAETNWQDVAKKNTIY